MKAAITKKYGKIEISNIKRPIPKENEILVKVYATTINRTDCANFRAKPFIMRFFIGLLKPKKIILGTDFAGKVEEIGKLVQSFKIGDKVFGFDDNILSSHAEYLVISKDKAIATFPSHLTYSLATASLEGFHYAYNFINKIDIKKGDKILVNGATGAIGSAMIQILKYKGAKITATCEGKNIKKIEYMKIDKIIDYKKEDFTKINEKFDFVLDSVGKSTFKKCKPILKKNGVYISSELGPWCQNVFYSIFIKKKVKFPIPTNTKESIKFVKKLIKEKKFTPLIDKTYKFEEIKKAYEYVEKGKKVGNVILKIN